MDDAGSVYADLSSGALKAVGVLLEYPAPDPDTQPRPPPAWSVPRRPGSPGSERAGAKRLAIGFIGAGNYASSMLLPHLVQLPNADLVHVTTTRSLSAVNAQRRFGFTTASTSASAVLEDESLDAIFIVTRHATHADLVCRALETGKAVFVEKPLALTGEELDRIIEVIAKTGNDRLMVGFNRRFAPMLTKMKSEFGPASSGAVTRYLVNAGPLAADSWYRNEGEGSRFTGEGGHFLDTLSWWADSLPEEVYAVARPGHRRRPGHRAVRQRRQRRDQLRHRRQRALPQGDAGRHRRRPQRAAGQLPQGHGLGRARARARSGPGAARTRGSAPSWPVSSRPAWPARRCRSRSSRWSPRPGRPSRCGRAC